MRILISGGNGLVGQNFREHSRAESVEVLAPPSSELNLLDYSAVKDYVKKTKPALIVHAAGLVGGIQANIKEPVRFLIENLDMGRNLVLAAREVGIRQFINLGSSCMYPRNVAGALREEQVLQGELEPTNEGYALAKVTVARLCSYINREDSSFNYKTLIPCNLYGRWDKFDPRHSHLLPSIIHKLHQAKVNDLSRIDIWGDGTARREFMYAADLADCIWMAIERFESTPAVMNVGLGFDYTIDEYYRLAAEVIGYTGEFVHDLSKPVGMQRKLLNVSQQKKWGWMAKTELSDGIRATYEFYCATQLNH